MFGLMRGDKKGDHFELALKAIHQIKNTDLLKKAKDEKTYANILVTALQASRKLKPHLTDQTTLEQDKKMFRVKAFGYDHVPDITIDNDGTAIEIKLIDSPDDIRDCIGQALIYRFSYRFAIMVMVDITKERLFVESLRSKDSKETKMLRELCDELNIMSVIGPGSNRRNTAFFRKSSHNKRKGEPAPPGTPASSEVRIFPSLPGN